MRKLMMMIPSSNKQWLPPPNTEMLFNKIKVKTRKNLTVLTTSQVWKKCALTSKPGSLQALATLSRRRKSEGNF